MDDLIPRAAAIAAFDDERVERNYGDVSPESVIRVIESIPAVDAEPVVLGHWIGIEYDGYADGNPVYDVWECSECGEEHRGEYDTLSNYCPNCGAKMSGTEGNE